MTLGLMLLLTVLAVALACFKWRRSSQALAGILMVAFFAVGCGPLPSALLTRLQANFVNENPVNWGQRNVIILLGAGTVRVGDVGPIEASVFAYGRITKAVALYRECKAADRSCKLEVSGGDARGLGISEAEIYGVDIRQLGVPSADLLLESRSMNTWQNAKFSAPLLQDESADHVLLVSSGFHLRRGMLYFSHFGIRATPVRADYISADWSWIPLAYNFSMMDVALHEYVGMARYHWYNVMGWNVAATAPGAP